MIPADELQSAAAVLSDLEWLANEIETACADRARIERQRRAAGLLFSTLDDPANVPFLIALLAECQFDSDTVLQWYSGHVERVEHWEQRLAYLTRAVEQLRPRIEQGIGHLEAPVRDRLMADLETRRNSIETWIYGHGPWP
jgi:hypothetical protein